MTASIKTVWKNENVKNFTEIFTFNGKTFKIHVQHKNGDPIGFNSNCALYIMVEDGSFKAILDSREAGIRYKNLYYSDDLSKIGEINSDAVGVFKTFVKKVYQEA